MNRKIQAVLSICLVGIFLAGCSLTGSSVQSSLTNYDNNNHNFFVTADPHATATATPFQPVGVSGTVSTPAPSSGGSATALPPTGPTAIPPTPTTVPYSARYPKPDGQVNLLILGSDFRPNAGYRTDTILLLSINTKQNTAALISFPRDLYVDIPGWEMQRINTAQAHGGFELTQATFEENFGVKPDHYIMTNFQGFKSIIDALGGINVYASKALSDKCDLPQKVKGNCNINVGYNEMNGATALWYVRSRYSTSDYDRNRRQQEVIQAIFVKLLSLNALTRAPELYNMFKSSVETDMSLTDMLALLPVATHFTDLSNLKRYAVDTSLASGWITPEGADVQVPNLDAIFNTVIAKACYGQ